MHFRFSLGLVLAGLLLLGCTRGDAPQAAPSSNTTDAPADPGAPVAVPASDSSAAAEIPLEIKSWAEVQEWVASQKGKIVVIDVWSTFCVTCVKEFPHFVELHRTHGDRIACASLSVDFYGGEGNKPEDVKPQVQEFLVSQQATMQNFLSRDTDEQVLQHIDTAAIPAALVYDREGKLHKVFNNDKDEYGPEGFNYEQDIVPLVEEMLKAGS